MEILAHEPIGKKTTMRIGNTARWYAELSTRADVEEATRFAKTHDVPLIVLGGGSNTIFADEEIHALVVRIAAAAVHNDNGTVRTQAGAFLASLLVELAKEGRDLSPLTGIPGTVGGAVFGNAGQGPQGIWIDRYIRTVTVWMYDAWQTLPRDACGFAYRESIFKRHGGPVPPIIWETVLDVPAADSAAIQEEIERLLQQRIATQPHRKTAGSCFKAVDGTPAWKLIDAAGLRGAQYGGVHISEKHANFLLSQPEATFADACSAVEAVRNAVSAPLDVEMRFVRPDGTLAF